MKYRGKIEKGIPRGPTRWGNDRNNFSPRFYFGPSILENDLFPEYTRRMVIDFSVNAHSENPIPTLVVKGEVDLYTCPQLRTAIEEALQNNSSHLLLDLEHIQYIDSTGLGTIAHFARQLQEKDGAIFIVCDKPQIKKIFEVSGLEGKNIRLFPTMDLALSELDKDS